MLKNIVFDLDGTLWHNGNTFNYSYNKVCDEYGISNRLTQNQVEAFLTATYKELMDGLFSWAGDDPDVPRKALRYTGEFVLKHPEECLFPKVRELLKETSSEYKIFLSSNCPKAFAELFLEVSDAKDLFTKVYTMEDGKKNLHLAEISASGKTLFVGDSHSDRDATIGCPDTLFCWASYGYKKCVLYDYKINTPSELLTVLKNIK